MSTPAAVTPAGTTPEATSAAVEPVTDSTQTAVVVMVRAVDRSQIVGHDGNI